MRNMFRKVICRQLGLGCKGHFFFLLGPIVNDAYFLCNLESENIEISNILHQMSYSSRSRLDLCGDYFVRNPEILLRNPKQYVRNGQDKRERGIMPASSYTQSIPSTAGLFGRRSEQFVPFMPIDITPCTIRLDTLRRETNEKQRSRWLRFEDLPWSPPTYIQQYTPGSQSHFELESNLIRTSSRFHRGCWKSRSSVPRFQRFLWSN